MLLIHLFATKYRITRPPLTNIEDLHEPETQNRKPQKVEYMNLIIPENAGNRRVLREIASLFDLPRAPV